MNEAFNLSLRIRALKASGTYENIQKAYELSDTFWCRYGMNYWSIEVF